MAFWTPGFWEIVVILIVAVLLFGARLPEVGRQLGRGLVEFKKGLKGIKDEVEKDANAEIESQQNAASTSSETEQKS